MILMAAAQLQAGVCGGGQLLLREGAGNSQRCCLLEDRPHSLLTLHFLGVCWEAIGSNRPSGEEVGEQEQQEQQERHERQQQQQEQRQRQQAAEAAEPEGVRERQRAAGAVLSQTFLLYQKRSW